MPYYKRNGTISHRRPFHGMGCNGNCGGGSVRPIGWAGVGYISADDGIDLKLSPADVAAVQKSADANVPAAEEKLPGTSAVPVSGLTIAIGVGVVVLGYYLFR